MQPQGPNAQQIEFWNGEAGNAWAENQARMDVLLQPLSESALGTLSVVPGERVLDVGCGCGGTALRIAELGGEVTGVDISAPMLARARERAEGRRGIEFVLADAAARDFDPIYDAVFSRFGVMFFADPAAAFANLRTALRPTGRITFVCWQTPRLNPWMAIPGAAVRALLPEPPAVDPRAPGPFAFADRDYVADVLARAGFGRVAIEPLAAQLTLGATVDEALDFTVRVGPLSRTMAELVTDVRHRAMEAVKTALAPHFRAGEVRLGALCWVVSATARA